VLEEAARLARGSIAPLDMLAPEAFDALILPGGYGVAKNFSDLAFRGAAMTVQPFIASVVRSFYEMRKPIGAICIAPVILSSILHHHEIMLTIGDDPTMADIIRAHGNHHHDSPTHHAVVDSRHRIVTCSAYMRGDASIRDVAQGIDELVHAIITIIHESMTQAA
jgi:enhancing lycopene biosynthesis protein 2